ncbi:hypothetical protein PR002_g18389 [Phytophthora rubi]|uniref:Integrase catalytic domain-containing protein n=1 Tax=Phytophthora rubi TaxID=129364 RepID=A0A6A3K246_9STRA|nr:hypothetical protein PR002_g18389 [Phytophthora rubi]
MQKSIHGNKYYLALKWLGYTHIFFLKHKSETAAAFKKYIAIISRRSRELPSTLLILRSDNGGEFEGSPFQQVCDGVGIEREYSEPNAHYQNGTVERANRTISESTRTLLVQSGLPHNLWEYAARHAVYVRNRVISRSYPNSTPYERYHGHAPDVSHLRVFGESVVAKIPDSKRSTRFKFRQRGRRGTFVGHDSERKGYFVYIREGGARIQRTCDVAFLQVCPTFDNPGSTAQSIPPPLDPPFDPEAETAGASTLDSARGSRPFGPAATVFRPPSRGGRPPGPAETVNSNLPRGSRPPGPAVTVTAPSSRGGRPQGPAVTVAAPSSRGGRPQGPAEPPISNRSRGGRPPGPADIPATTDAVTGEIPDADHLPDSLVE